MIRKLLGIAAAAVLFGACLPAFANEATGEGFPPAQNLNYYHMPGPDMAVDGTAAPSAVNADNYLFVAGSAFTPRTSSQTVTYPGGGCTYTDGYTNTSLNLPEGVSVLGVRLFYYNNGSSGSVTAILNTFAGDSNANTLLSANSTMNTGYSSEYLVLASPSVIDNFNKSYLLIGAMRANTRLCGMRVFYSE